MKIAVRLKSSDLRYRPERPRRSSTLADYVVAVKADLPPIEVHFLDFPDKEFNELGARGIGEIGLAGMAAAITAAVYHATEVPCANCR